MVNCTKQFYVLNDTHSILPVISMFIVFIALKIIASCFFKFVSVKIQVGLFSNDKEFIYENGHKIIVFLFNSKCLFCRKDISYKPFSTNEILQACHCSVDSSMENILTSYIH